MGKRLKCQWCIFEIKYNGYGLGKKGWNVLREHILVDHTDKLLDNAEFCREIDTFIWQYDV